MVGCALPLPLVTILVTVTPPPYDPAKQNALKNQNLSAFGGPAHPTGPLRSVALLHSAAGSDARKNLQQDNEARKNLTQPRRTLAESGRLGGKGLMGRCLGAAATAAGWFPAPWTAEGVLAA